MAARGRAFQPERSPKAGKPLEERRGSAWVRRRRKSATVAVKKDGTVIQTDHGPRVVRGAKTPKVKKR